MLFSPAEPSCLDGADPTAEYLAHLSIRLTPTTVIARLDRKSGLPDFGTY